jgi:hypothetical protein
VTGKTRRIYSKRTNEKNRIINIKVFLHFTECSWPNPLSQTGRWINERNRREGKAKERMNNEGRSKKESQKEIIKPFKSWTWSNINLV